MESERMKPHLQRSSLELIALSEKRLTRSESCFSEKQAISLFASVFLVPERRATQVAFAVGRGREHSSPSRLSSQDQKALIAVAVQFFSNGAMTSSFVARAPQLRDNIGVSIGGYGLLLTTSAVAGIVISLFVGRLIHNTSTRSVLGMGAIIMILCLPLIGGAQSPLLWLTGILLYVFFDTLVDISMNLQGSWISARRHAPVMNRLHGVWSLGYLTGGAGAAIANAAGWSTFSHLLGVALLMALVLGWSSRFLLTQDAVSEELDAESELAGGRGQRGTVLRLPLVLIAFAGLFAVMMEAAGGDWATFRLSDDLSASGVVASLALVAYTAGMVAMRFLGDHLQMRIGQSTLHRLSLFLSVFGFGLATMVGSQWVALTGFFFVGLGVATFTPQLYDEAASIPGQRGAGLGAMNVGMRSAQLLTPLLVGSLAQGSLSVGSSLALCAFPAALGLALVSWLRGQQKHSELVDRN